MPRGCLLLLLPHTHTHTQTARELPQRRLPRCLRLRQRLVAAVRLPLKLFVVVHNYATFVCRQGQKQKQGEGQGTEVTVGGGFSQQRLNVLRILITFSICLLLGNHNFVIYRNFLLISFFIVLFLPQLKVHSRNLNRNPTAVCQRFPPASRHPEVDFHR